MIAIVFAGLDILRYAMAGAGISADLEVSRAEVSTWGIGRVYN